MFCFIHLFEHSFSCNPRIRLQTCVHRVGVSFHAQYVLYKNHVCMCKLLEVMLSWRWICLITYNTNQSLSVVLPVLSSLPLSSALIFLSLSSLPLPASPSHFFSALPRVFPLTPCPSCSIISCCYPLTYFPICKTFSPPVPYQQPSPSSLSHSLYLPLYNGWEAGVVFSSSVHFLPVVLLPWCQNGWSAEGFGWLWGRVRNWNNALRMPWDALC